MIITVFWKDYRLRGLARVFVDIVVATDVCLAPLDHGRRVMVYDLYGEPWFTSSTVGPFSFHSGTTARRFAYMSVLLWISVSLLISIGSVSSCLPTQLVIEPVALRNLSLLLC